MMVAVNVGIYNVPATVSKERSDTMAAGNHKGFYIMHKWFHVNPFDKSIIFDIYIILHKIKII